MIRISNKSIGLNYRPFIIAEMSGNHNQSLEKALEIVEIAAATGVHVLNYKLARRILLHLMLRIEPACGRESRCTNSIRRLIPLGNGMNR